MKNLLLFLALSTTALFTSCEGDPGPPGPPGEPGINILGQVFEVTTDFQFDQNNVLQSTVAIPSDVEVFESDVILVYRLEGQVTLNDGTVADAWSPLPQNFFTGPTNEDIIQYVYNHTFVDVQLIIDGNFDLTTLGPAFTNDQTFRIAIVPSEYARTDFSKLSMEQLLENLQIEPQNIQKIDQ